MNTPTKIAFALIGSEVVMAATMVVGGVHTTGVAIADPVTVTVDGREYPLCAVEDCSDQPGQVGVWRSRTGPAGDWLIVGEDTYPITRCGIPVCI